MKIIKSDLQSIAVKPEQYPKDDLIEIAFAGDPMLESHHLLIQ